MQATQDTPTAAQAAPEVTVAQLTEPSSTRATFAELQLLANMNDLIQHALEQDATHLHLELTAGQITVRASLRYAEMEHIDLVIPYGVNPQLALDFCRSLVGLAPQRLARENCEVASGPLPGTRHEEELTVTTYHNPQLGSSVVLSFGDDDSYDYCDY